MEIFHHFNNCSWVTAGGLEPETSKPFAKNCRLYERGEFADEGKGFVNVERQVNAQSPCSRGLLRG